MHSALDLFSFDEVHQDSIEALGMNEGDLGAARSRPAHGVDQGMTGARKRGKRAIDVGDFDRDVMQPGPPRRDEASDRRC
jgi:hypothetical protein